MNKFNTYSILIINRQIVRLFMEFTSFKINYKYLLSFVIFTVINFLPANLLAQVDEAYSLEEVVVTARKKEESLQNTRRCCDCLFWK